MIGAISSALQGLFTASQAVNKAANNIATASSEGVDTVDLSEEAVNLKLGEYAYRANLATIETTREMQDDLLRIIDKRV